MKIAVITLHRFDNVGSCLQACALCKYIENLGHDVYLIDYTPQYKEYYTWRKILAKLLNRKNVNARMRKIGQCLEENTKLSKRYYSKKALFNKPPQADIYISGGDQIWNPQYPNYYDDAFYLKFAPLAPKMSYGSSVSVSELTAKQVEYLRERVSNYKSINVREKRTVELFIRKEINLNTHYVMDPVFLMKDMFYLSIMKKPEGLKLDKDEPFILAYHLDPGKELNSYICKLRDTTGCKLVSLIGYKKRWDSDFYFRDYGPLEFLWLVRHAKFVLTGSFHALSFSLILNTPFLIQIPGNSPNRLLNLLDEVGLSDRIIHREEDIIKITNTNLPTSRTQIPNPAATINNKALSRYCFCIKLCSNCNQTKIVQLCQIRQPISLISSLLYGTLRTIEVWHSKGLSSYTCSNANQS
jgi:hypothetical protein